ncbi:MAG: DUF951 domain-containing protein [Erysipelotrichaceae bacterium]|nr:DUF951 domain-containing protein [Erysipelotrichaceae bacterium]
MVTPLSYVLYDEVEMKKAHPCFHRCKRFQILRLGADVKILCLGCGAILLMDRDHFNHAIKKVIAHHDRPLTDAPQK